MAFLKLSGLLTILAIFQHLLSGLLYLNRFPLLISIQETLLAICFRFYSLSPCTVDLDEETTMHFWAANHRRFDKPDLVMIHGFGGNSRWQFIFQVGSLSRSFNLYVPDLLFFGRSYTNRSDRTVVFQAKCVAEGLKRLGVDRFSIYGLSYGGYVAYWMAEMYPKEVGKVVIVSSGIGWTHDKRQEHIEKVGRNVIEILMPENPHDQRLLGKMSMHKHDPCKWVPDFVLRRFIHMNNAHKKKKLDLLDHILSDKPDPQNLPVLSQETLVVWGDKDRVFPLYLANELQRHLGSKSKLEIIKDAGHAVNYDSPDLLNSLIKSFVLGCSEV